MGVAQKMCPPHPLEVENSFGGKSILSVARGTKFGGKLKTYEYYNWWKFGVNISRGTKCTTGCRLQWMINFG